MRAVGVIVPARDEEQRVEACLAAVFTALDRLPRSVTTAVCLVVDRSQDRTAERARRAAQGRPNVQIVVNEAPSTVGGLRNTAADVVLDQLPPRRTQDTWLLSTDADSRVPREWATRHLAYADAGVDAVSGGVLADGPAPTGLLVPDGVYAANLGLGAEPFLRVGGFPAVHCGEDAEVLRRLRETGHHVVTGAGIYVRTSVRTRGRAAGGLADRLREGA